MFWGGVELLTYLMGESQRQLDLVGNLLCISSALGWDTNGTETGLGSRSGQTKSAHDVLCDVRAFLKLQKV